jgi:hypothetical protein
MVAEPLFKIVTFDDVVMSVGSLTALFPVTGSVFGPLTVAWLVRVVVPVFAATVATIWSGAAKSPTAIPAVVVHVTVGAEDTQSHPVPIQEASVSCAGRVSTTVMVPPVSDGPEFPAVSVYVTVLPANTEPVGCVFVMVRSEDPVGAPSVEPLAFGALAALTVAMFVTVEVVEAGTLTTIRTVAVLLPLAAESVPLSVQVTVEGAVDPPEHDHPGVTEVLDCA